jgi:beta-1,4-mannosyl-glycoprotein beta-1,4-N-acetylglucosaminyltransferase
MIYDTFMFFNEVELLKCRLTELWNVVDQFVLVESRQSHRGKPKPLFYADNKDAFAKWNSKIVSLEADHSHILGDELKANMLREKNARITLDSYPFNTDATVVYGDADEIVRPDLIAEYRNTNVLKWFEMSFFHYFFNCRQTPCPDGARPVILPATLLKSMGVEVARWTHAFYPHISTRGIPNGGWHFSFFGNSDALRYKIDNAVEGSTSDWIQKETTETLQSRIDAGRRYDDGLQYEFLGPEGLPKYVQERWKEFIAKGYVKERLVPKRVECDSLMP